jgi:ketosteroid isomerase-like protein
VTGHADIEILERIYADWGRGDYSSGEFLHPEFELVFAPGFLDEGVFKGPAEAWRGWRGWLEQWEKWAYEVARYQELEDGRIVAVLDITGVAKTTGLELTFRSANLWEIEDGLARRVRLYAHHDDLVRELGLDSA